MSCLIPKQLQTVSGCIVHGGTATLEEAVSWADRSSSTIRCLPSTIVVPSGVSETRLMAMRWSDGDEERLEFPNSVST